MNIQEMKAKAYDIIGQIEYLQSMLRELNKQIQEAQNKDLSESPKE